jgi:hypothetical protein
MSLNHTVVKRQEVVLDAGSRAIGATPAMALYARCQL